jgi:hypothetical protein
MGKTQTAKEVTMDSGWALIIAGIAAVVFTVFIVAVLLL